MPQRRKEQKKYKTQDWNANVKAGITTLHSTGARVPFCDSIPHSHSARRSYASHNFDGGILHRKYHCSRLPTPRNKATSTRVVHPFQILYGLLKLNLSIPTGVEYRTMTGTVHHPFFPTAEKGRPTKGVSLSPIWGTPSVFLVRGG